MFEFNRGGIDYTIKYASGTQANMLICEYFISGTANWRWQGDTDDIGGVYPTEVEFYDYFILKLNERLDVAHDDEIDPTDPIDRLTELVKNQTTFDGKHLHVNHH